MVRPRRNRKIKFNPEVTYFKPRGIPLKNLEEINLEMEEIEAIRLKDFLELDQVECAKKMNISQSTFHRTITSARKKIANAIIKGKAIQIKNLINKENK